MVDTPKTLDALVNSNAPKTNLAVSAISAVTHGFGILLSAAAAYECFLLEIYTKHVFAEPGFELNAIKQHVTSSGAEPLTLNSFIDFNITLAQQNPDAVAVGIAGFAAFYALSRVMHAAQFGNNTPATAQPDPRLYLVK